MDKQHVSSLDYHAYSEEELILHATLLSMTVNKVMSKEETLRLYRLLSKEELVQYIEHFYDPQPDIAGIVDEPASALLDDEPHNAYRCATARDYGPSNPWDAPGMSVRDFI